MIINVLFKTCLISFVSLKNIFNSKEKYCLDNTAILSDIGGGGKAFSTTPPSADV